MNNIDKKITDNIKERTEKDVSRLEEEVWVNLDHELFSEKKDVKKMKKKNRFVPIMMTVAAALVVVFGLQTDLGMAFVKGVKDMFVSEKEITQNLEGQDEVTDVTLNEGKDSEYVIYIDETRYKMIPGDNVDKITTLEALPEEYPEVSMEISQVVDEKPEDLVWKIESELKSDFPELREIETVTEPVEGFLLHGLNGNDWNSKVVHLYVISNGKEGSYVIKGNYFLEAAEGHGARFHHMLESFKIVE